MLILLPNLLGGDLLDERYFPPGIAAAVETLDGLIAESVPAGRTFLKRFKTKKPAHLIPIAHLQKSTTRDEIDFFLDPLTKGQRFGLISDAGMPCVADPGSLVVKRAKERGIPVSMVMGPSSLLMGLMLSGLSGQAFTFHGYLPKKQEELVKKLEKMEKGYTHLFIEAPFRNQKLFSWLMHALPDKAQLSLAIDLTLPTEEVITQEVARWKKTGMPALDGRYVLFLFQHLV
jgi:16S rRNA (cytidine1402-2'-O)-methyltransferase